MEENVVPESGTLPEDETTLKSVVFGSEVKLYEDGTVEGYLVQFGRPEEADFDGDYFTTETDFDVDWGEGGKSTVYFNHGLDPLVGKSKLCGGQKAVLTLKNEGVWIEAKLKEGERYDEMVKRLMQKRRVGWSSGVPAHLVEKEAREGAHWVKKWSLGTDASLTHTPNDWRNVATLKSLAEVLEALPEDGDARAVSADEQGGVSEHVEQVSEVKAVSTSVESDNMEQVKTERLISATIEAVAGQMKMVMSDDEKVAAKAAALEAYTKMCGDSEQDEEQAMKAVTDPAFIEEIAAITRRVTAVENGRVEDAVKSAFAARQPVSQAPAFTGKPAAAPSISVKSKFDALSAQDMAFYYTMRKSAAHAQGMTYTADLPFMREMIDKAQKSYSAGDLKFASEDASALKAITSIKSNELDHSTQSGYGDEWVPTLHSADLWDKVRLENVVAPRIRFIEMPSTPFELPVQTTDPTVYKVAETTAENQLTLADSNSPIPDSKVATTKVTLTAAKLGLRVGISAEVEEDSIIPFIANARAQAMRAFADAVDNVILNGDTATTLNVNSDGESISDTTRKYLVFNGMIKAPVVTTTSMSINAQGASPTLALLRRARAKLASGYGTDIRNLMFLTDYSTYIKLLAIDEVSSAANRGSAPTGVTGILGGIDGIDLFVSNEMALADTDGKVTQTANTTDTGRILLVHRQSWIGGYRRRLTSALNFYPEYDMYSLAMTLRLALINRDTTSTAIIYNIGI